MNEPSESSEPNEKEQLDLWSAEERFKTIFENSAVAITVTDEQERIVSWNKLAERLLEMDYADLHLVPVSSLYSPEEWGKIRSYNIRTKGMQEHVETRIRKKDGSLIDVDVSISVLKNPEGRVTGSIGIIRDITEKKKAEKELRNAEERYRTIFENSAVAITVTDANEKIISWNAFAEGLFGMDKADLYLRPVHTLYSPEEWGKIRSYNIRQKGMQHHLETRVIRKDGEVIDVDISISVLKDPDGRITGSIGIIRDITERKIAEKQLMSINEELERRVAARTAELIQSEKMKSVGRLAAGAAHEVKNPLAILVQGIYYLRNLIPDAGEEAMSALKDMEEAAERADNVIKELLNFSSASQAILKSENMHLVIEQALRLTKHEFDSRQVHLETNLTEDLPPLRIDANKVLQVFINVFMNAIQAAGENGVVRVRSRSRKVPESRGPFIALKNADFKPGEEVIIVEVENNGRPIDEGAMERLFDPFYTTKRESGGTGLGLTVVKHIMDMHQAVVSIKNKRNGGVCVTLVFRKAPRVEQSDAQRLLDGE